MLLDAEEPPYHHPQMHLCPWWQVQGELTIVVSNAPLSNLSTLHKIMAKHNNYGDRQSVDLRTLS